jgi:hypothetical protein
VCEIVPDLPNYSPASGKIRAYDTVAASRVKVTRHNTWADHGDGSIFQSAARKRAAVSKDSQKRLVLSRESEGVRYKGANYAR